jgi:hypothetical protein
MKTTIPLPASPQSKGKEQEESIAASKSIDTQPTLGVVNAVNDEPDDDATPSIYYWVLVGLILFCLLAYAVAWAVLLSPVL